MGTAGAPRGPAAPPTAILFLAGDPPGTGWREGVSESPWLRSALRSHGGFSRAAESRRETADFPFLTAAKPPRSECSTGHRQPVGGAPSALKGDAYIVATDGEPTPPEGTPAYMVMEKKGVAPCLWMKQWHKLTEKEGCLAFPEHGTFNPKVLENLRWMLSTQKTPQRPAQYEALAIWDLMALKHRQEKFQRRLKRAEKSYAEARWDNKNKMWRRGIVDGLKLFPAIAQGEESQGKKASCKTDKDSSKSKENKRPWEEEDDSDDEEFMDRLLHDRPPPYAVSDSAPGTSVDPGNQTQEKGVTDTVQTSDTTSIQNGVSVPTSSDMQIQLQPPPQIQRIYPDIPVST
ncbi:hypothetical protein NDU88_003585 [Pleurodeles waltl]|uniref:Uncharacterized protein n=1 Tax=Pleurodeles waltl TaxID=8319 RepID=A0AAV7W552_PLEWA|nr:hypothetical protein NDU88_003585 [Pleurodeles waltl]